MSNESRLFRIFVPKLVLVALLSVHASTLLAQPGATQLPPIQQDSVLASEILNELFPWFGVLDCDWGSSDGCQARECAAQLISTVVQEGVPGLISPQISIGGLSAILGRLGLGPLSLVYSIADVLYRSFLREVGFFASVPTSIGAQGPVADSGPRTECLGFFAVVGGSMSSCLSLLKNSSCHGRNANNELVYFCGPRQVTGPSGETVTVFCDWSLGCEAANLDNGGTLLDALYALEVFADALNGLVFDGFPGGLQDVLAGDCTRP